MYEQVLAIKGPKDKLYKWKFMFVFKDEAHVKNILLIHCSLGSAKLAVFLWRSQKSICHT